MAKFKKSSKYVGGGSKKWTPERRERFFATLASKKAQAAIKIARLPEASMSENGSGNRKLELVNRILDAPDAVLDTIEKVLKVA